MQGSLLEEVTWVLSRAACQAGGQPWAWESEVLRVFKEMEETGTVAA